MTNADSLETRVARLKTRVFLMQTQRQLEDFIVMMGRDSRLHNLARDIVKLFDSVIRTEMTLDKCDLPAIAAIVTTFSSQVDALVCQADSLTARMLAAAPGDSAGKSAEGEVN